MVVVGGLSANISVPRDAQMTQDSFEASIDPIDSCHFALGFLITFHFHNKIHTETVVVAQCTFLA